MCISCTWTPGLYQELRQAGDGTATGMLKTWFNSVGWPTVLGTGDHGSYATAILRMKDGLLQEMLRDGEVPLRPGGCSGDNGIRPVPLSCRIPPLKCVWRSH